MDIMNKKIVLQDGNEYVIIDSTEVDGKTYYLGNDVEDDKLGNDIAVFTIENNNGEYSINFESNIEICEKVINQIDKKISSN